MSGSGEEVGGRGDPTEDRSSSSSFEDLATAELDEARREAAAEELKAAERLKAAEKLKAAEILEAAETEELKEKHSASETKGSDDEWQDVLGSGVILKKILKCGEDDEDAPRPQRSNVCRVSYVLRLRDSDGGPGALIESRDQVKIYLGDNEVLQGMDLAFSLMYKSETCLLQISPRFGYGERGLAAGEAAGAPGAEGPHAGAPVPPGAWLHAELTLHDWSEEPEHETLSYAERMEVGGRRRARGNWWYERGEAALAVQLYRRALDALDESSGGISEPTESGAPAPTSQALRALLEERVRVYNNMAAAQLKAGAYEAALTAVNHVLTCEPSNAKALYRKACVLGAMGRGGEALAAARAAAAAAPGDAAVRRELARCEGRAERDRSAERRLARRMLGADRPPPEPKKPSRNKVLLWGSLILSVVVGVASVLVYRYRSQSQ